jgi:hypothetical protein
VNLDRHAESNCRRTNQTFAGRMMRVSVVAQPMLKNSSALSLLNAIPCADQFTALPPI